MNRKFESQSVLYDIISVQRPLKFFISLVMHACHRDYLQMSNDWLYIYYIRTSEVDDIKTVWRSSQTSFHERSGTPICVTWSLVKINYQLIVIKLKVHFPDPDPDPDNFDNDSL